MMRIYHICVLFLFVGALSACGFQPIYDTQQSREALGEIHIDPINDRLGQMLRNNLLELQGGTRKAVKYRLASQVRERTTELSVTRDDEVTLANLVVTLTYELRDAATGAIVTQGRMKGQTSYDLIDSPFSEINSDRQAKRALAQSLAQRLANRLSAALSKVDAP